MIPSVVNNPASGQPVVVASLERKRVAVQKQVQEACNEFLNEPDWEKNMTIVDELNRAPYLCPFAIAEIRMRLKTKNPEIEILALQLTETIIKNCPSSHAAIAEAAFMRYLVKVGKNQREGGTFTQIGSKFKRKSTKINSAHIRSQCIEKALLILKMLAMAYSDSHLYPVFNATYKQLQNQKVRFPETNKDESLNVFSPIHSTGAPDEFQPTALGSVQNEKMHLPMIRPVTLLEDIIQPELVTAQEQAMLLFTMINAPQLSYDLIPDITQMLRNSQQQIVVIISAENAVEAVLMQALQINEIVNSVLEDAEHIMNGTKRRYQEEVDMKKLMRAETQMNLGKGKDDAKNNGDDDVELEQSISIEDDGDLFAIRASSKDQLHTRTKSKQKKRQSVDLLGLNGDDLMASGPKDAPKKDESSDDILGFLGVNQPAQPVKPQPQVLDPMDPNFGAIDPVNSMTSSMNSMSMNPNPMQQPAAFMQNNGNVFRNPVNPVNPMMNNGNIPMNNGNIPMQNQYNTQNQYNIQNPIPIQNNNPLHNASAPSINSIQQGNQSVLNVLTGVEGVTSVEQSPQQVSPKQNTPGKAIPFKSADALPQQQTKGGDPFGGMDDPFADMDAPPSFDTPIANKVNTKPAQPVQKPVQKAPANLQKQNSDNLIIDMFASGGPPDPNLKPKSQTKQPVKKVDDNPFDSSNPFGSSTDLASPDKGDNPFEDLDNPFGDSVDEVVANDDNQDNPFSMFSPVDNQRTKKKDDFMADRDPFADM